MQAGADKAQQAGLLRQCLACWNLGAAGGEAAQESTRQDTVEMLVAFVDQSDGPTAAQIVDIAQVSSHSCMSRSLKCMHMMHVSSNMCEEACRCSTHKYASEGSVLGRHWIS